MVAVTLPSARAVAPSEAPRALLQVRLRRLSAFDRQAVRRWMRDPDVIRHTVLVPGPEYGPVHPYPAAAADRYLRTLTDDPSRHAFAIVADGQHVGNVGLKEVDLPARRAECFIEIGEASARQRGVGRRAMQLLLDYAFNGPQIERLRLGVFEFNEPALRLYASLGFAHDGLYGWHYAAGRFWRVLQMSLDDAAWRRTAPVSHTERSGCPL